MIVLNVLGLSFLVSHYKDFLKEGLVVVNNPLLITRIPVKIINCMKCSSFWIGLILTDWNLPLSGFISLLGFLVDKYLLSTDIKL